MRSLFVVAALVCGTAASAQSIDEAVASAAASGLTGQVVVADQRRVIFDHTLGLPSAPKQWIWGSVSKQVTAALVMQEVDRGLLKLDDRVADHLPHFANAEGRQVTIRELLQHTSGLANPDRGTKSDEVPAFYFRTNKGASGDSDAVGFCAGPLSGTRGVFVYNNCDTIVAGAILERVTRKSFGKLLAERLTKPLRMTSTRLARPGERLELGSSQSSKRRVNVAAYGPSGAIIGSARDLVRFDQALLAGKLISAAARDEMWTGQPSLGFVALGAWSFAAPLNGCTGQVRLVERRGSVDGVQSRNIIAPDLGRALIVFTPNSSLDFGEIWQGKGLSYSLASAAFCT